VKLSIEKTEHENGQIDNVDSDCHKKRKNSEFFLTTIRSYVVCIIRYFLFVIMIGEISLNKI